MSRNPASAKNSPSARVETVIGPIAPPCCMRPISIVLWVFTCGRNSTPDARALPRMRAQFCSTIVRSTRNAGVCRFESKSSIATKCGKAQCETAKCGISKFETTDKNLGRQNVNDKIRDDKIRDGEICNSEMWDGLQPVRRTE